MFGALKKLSEDGPDLGGCARLIAAWPSIVGPNLVRHLWPVTVWDHVLTVEGSSSEWLNEARFHADAMLENIARQVEGVRITEIRFRMSRSGEAPYELRTDGPEQRQDQGLSPEASLAPEVEQEIDEIVGKVESKQLRERLRRVFRLSKLAELARRH